MTINKYRCNEKIVEAIKLTNNIDTIKNSISFVTSYPANVIGEWQLDRAIKQITKEGFMVISAHRLDDKIRVLRAPLGHYIVKDDKNFLVVDNENFNKEYQPI